MKIGKEIPNHIQINTSTKIFTKKQILFQLNRRFPKKHRLNDLDTENCIRN